MLRQCLLLVCCLAAVSTAENTACKDIKVDIMYAFDISKSIRDPEMNLVRSAFNKMVKEYKIGLAETRVGVITFGKGAQTVHELGKITSNADMESLKPEEQIPRPPFKDLLGGTETDKGLERCMESFRSHGRENVPQVCVVVTDGMSTTMVETEVASYKIHDTTSIQVIAVAIGKEVRQSELEMMASGSEDQNVYLVRDFKGFVRIGQQIVEKTCLISEQIANSAVSCERPCLKFGSVFGQRLVGDSMTFSCDPGYSLNGAASATCQTDGKWSAPIPTCVQVKRCPFKAGIPKGRVRRSKNHNHDGGTVTFSCITNYILEGYGTATCNDGQWDNAQPKCVYKKCRSISGITNGHIKRQVTMPGKKVTFKCDRGYVLEGPNALTCGTNREWEYNGQPAQPPVCKPIGCNPPLTTFKNGDVEVDGNKYTFTCHPNYKRIGAAERTCDTSTNTWSPVDLPECKYAACKSIPLMKNGKISYSEANNKMTVTCNVGYKLKSGDGIYNCVDSVWTDKDGNIEINGCELNACKVISMFKNGHVTGYNNLIGTKLTFQCNQGYTLSNTNEFKCEDNAKWSLTNVPRCKPVRGAVKEVKCWQILTLSGHGHCTGSNSIGGSVTCGCDRGYKLHGDEKLTCQDDGRWDKGIPSCKWHSCPVPPALRGGTVEAEGMYVGAKMKATCHGGYTYTGSEQIECQEDLTWSGSVQCTYGRCANILKIKKGRSTGVGDKDGSTRTFSCKDGYALDGPSTAKCENNEWTPGIPKCVPNTCRPLQYINNGKIEGTDYRVGSSVKVKCDKDYRVDPEGADVVNCQADRSWDKAVRCSYNKCSPITHFKDGTVSNYGEEIGRKIRLKCDPGFSLTDSNGERKKKTTLTCDFSDQVGPHWSADIPVCERDITCPSICPKRGRAYGSYLSKSPSSTVYFGCPIGTTLSVDDTATCNANGEWSTGSDPPACKSEMPVECEGARMDVIVMVDQSKSISTGEYVKIVQFIRSIINSFDIGTTKTRIGLVMFSKGAKTVQALDEHATKESMNAQLYEVTARPENSADISGTRADKGLKEIRKQKLFSDEEVPRICLVVTDGKSNKPEKTIAEAEKLKKTGVKIFSVGIGDGADMDELKTIASDDSYVFEVKKVDKAIHQAKKIIEVACKAVPPVDNIASVLSVQSQALDPADVSVAPECKDQPLDMCLAVDTSRSIQAHELKTMKAIVGIIVNNLDVSPGNTKVALVTFDGRSRLDIHLGEFTSNKEILDSPKFVHQPTGSDLKGGTRTDLALRICKEVFQNATNADRPRSIILVTDGQPQGKNLDMPGAIKEIKDESFKITTEVVLIGNNFQEGLMRDISSSGSFVHFSSFKKVDAGQLIGVAKSACKNSA